MNPLVSVIMPVYNREGLISESLNCLLAQSYHNWECIVIDDASTDSTIHKVKQFTEKDNRFRLFSRPSHSSKGAASCRNIGLENAQGAFIQFLDSDDLLSSNKLQKQIEFLNDQRNTVAFCNWIFFKRSHPSKEQNQKLPFNKEFYKPLEVLELLGNNNTYLPVHAYLIPAKLVRQAGAWDENLSNNDDAEFLSRVLVHASKVIYVKDVMAYYRKLPQNTGLSAYSNEEMVSSVVRSWQKIENTLQNHFRKSHFIYVENSKNRLYRNIIWENPELINAHQEFFKDQIEERNRQQKRSFIDKVWRKLKYIIG